MTRTVRIGCFREHLGEEVREAAIVAIDVIRATTTAITAVAGGRRCFPAASIEAAVPLAARLDDPLLAGELGGSRPYGFHAQNSPAALDVLERRERPLVLLSTSGTRLMAEAGRRANAYAACLRNTSAQAAHLIAHHESVRLLGADSRGEFREEDQLCCARIGALLLDAGYEPADAPTRKVIERWDGAPDDAFVGGASTAFLADTAQLHDLDFILAHVDDLAAVFPLVEGEVVMEVASPRAAPPPARR